MSEHDGALTVLNRVIEAMNEGDSAAVLANMTENVVIVDDVAPFYRSGYAGANDWLYSLSRARNVLQAAFRLQFAEANEVDDRAYIVAPGVWSGKIPEEDMTVDGLLTATLVRRGGRWLVNALIWGSMP